MCVLCISESLCQSSVFCVVSECVFCALVRVYICVSFYFQCVFLSANVFCIPVPCLLD